MEPFATYLADGMDRPKGPADLTTAALHGLDRAWYNTLPIYLGSKMVKIVCGDAEHRPQVHTSRAFPSTFTIHRDLLCQYSRSFRQKLGLDLGKEIIASCLNRIEMDDEMAAKEGRENKYLSFDSVPPCYTPSWVDFADDYRRQAREVSPVESPRQAATEPPAEELILLESEPKDLFAIFVHWLYTQNLVLDDFATPFDKEVLCTRVYALAERLDVPALRQQCYQKLHSYCSEDKRLPEIGVLEVIINRCDPGSLLRKYMVALIAHEIIAHGHASNERCGPMLALDKTFAAEIALDIMDRLRSDKVSADPNTEYAYEVDDSDSDVNSSIAYYSDSECDSEVNMTISVGEEEESVAGDAPETSHTITNAPPSSSALSDLSSSGYTNIPIASASSSTSGRLPAVKIKADSSDDHTLSEINANANKRKRVSQSIGDNDKHQNKRSDSGKSDETEIIDLAEWARV